MSTTLNPNKKALEKALVEKHQIYMRLLKQKATDNLYLFNKLVLDADSGDESFVKLAPFHKELCNFVQDRYDKKKLILIPRAHLKTKLITRGYTLNRIAHNPKIRILIYSATWQMAVDILSAVVKEIQVNEKFKALYGDLKYEAPIWSQDRIKFAINKKREPSVTAAGIDNNLVGGHYDLIIMDDVVNRDNINTMDQILKVENRYKDSLDLLEPGGQLIVIGTRWHDSDLYGWILDQENDIYKNYDIMIKQAYEGNISEAKGFKALWPEKFSRRELSRRLREEGWYHFSAQYMNEPVPEDDAIFKKSWFTYYDEFFIRGKLLNKFMAIDPALSEKKDADYTAMVVVGVDEHGYIMVLDIVKERFSPNDLINEMFRMRDKWGLSDVGLETVAFQKVLAYALREDDRFKKRPFHITELKANERSKDQRIRALQPLYENGKILHNKNLKNNVYLEDELTRFPRSRHDDVVDALSYTLDFIYPAKQTSKRRSSGRRYLY